MTDAQAIAKQLGGVKPDDEWLQAEIARLKGKSIVPLLEVDAERLTQMLPSAGVGMQHEPIRLCGACYGENPCHRIEWQYTSVWKCDRHQLKILAKCPNCEAPFKMPALWEDGFCHRCRMPFVEMAKLQKGL